MLQMAGRPSLLDVLIRGTPEPPEPVRQEMLGLMYSRFHSYKVPVAVMTLLTGGLAFAVLSLHGFSIITVAWFSLVVAFSALMFKSGHRKLGFDPRNIRSGRFVKRAERASFVLGAVWSSVCFIQTGQDTVAQVVLIALAMGMACGAVLFTAPLVGVGVRYLQATLVVILIAAFMWNNEWVLVISVFGVALMAGLYVSAMSLYRSTYEIVTSSHEARKMGTLLEQSLENATYGFAILSPSGAVLVSNSYHRDSFTDLSNADLEIGRREVRVHADRWLVRDVTSLPNGNIMISHTDISQQKEVERDLRDLHDEILQTERARSEFIAQASSSIETPARFIRALASAFSIQSRIEFRPEERARLAEELEREAHKLITLVQTLRNSVTTAQMVNTSPRSPTKDVIEDATSHLDARITFDVSAQSVALDIPAGLFRTAITASADWVLADGQGPLLVRAHVSESGKLQIDFETPSAGRAKGPAIVLRPAGNASSDRGAQAVQEIWQAVRCDGIGFETSALGRVIRVTLPLGAQIANWNRVSGAIEMRA